MFERVLIANRGEIAVRIIRTLRRMGVVAVAVYSDADRLAPHVRMADVAVPLGGARAYLDADLLLSVAASQGVDAVHPGYGFLSENAAFARACSQTGAIFIGPPADAIETMGDKINAKRTVAASGVPVVPGRDEAGLDDRQLAEAVAAVGLPVLLKPSAGGGGKGMRLITSEADLPSFIEAARREAKGAFGDDTLLVERYVNQPRHIEMQIFADSHGTFVALGERECSLQRRYQKIIEEAPSPLLDPATRAAMAESAVAAAKACGYVGAGTVEFIVSADLPDEYFFMEMNTRLQVEHPVTEAVLGVDLVELQLRVAVGEHLPWRSQTDVPQPSCHAVEARLYAEDTVRGFLPSSGRILALRVPGSMPSVRVDSGIDEGLEVGTTYDPMLAKVIAWGADRSVALRRLDLALASTTVLGVTTNIGFLRRLLRDPAVVAGDLDTGLVERRAASLQVATVPDEVFAAAALLAEHRASIMVAAGAPTDPWAVADGWHVAGPKPRKTRWRAGSTTVEVAVAGGCVVVDGRPLGTVAFWPESGGCISVEAAGAMKSYAWAADGDDVWLGTAGESWRLTRERFMVLHKGRSVAGTGRIVSPMPGTVLAVYVEPGLPVEASARLVVVEAMKMEHTVSAGEGGTVVEVLVRPGDTVRLEQPLVVIDVSRDQP